MGLTYSAYLAYLALLTLQGYGEGLACNSSLAKVAIIILNEESNYSTET